MAFPKLGSPTLMRSLLISLPQSGLRLQTAGQGDEQPRVRLATLQEEFGRRLASQPAVRRWAFSDEAPGEESDERSVRVEGDGYPTDHPGLPGVATFVDPAFWDRGRGPPFGTTPPMRVPAPRRRDPRADSALGIAAARRAPGP